MSHRQSISGSSLLEVVFSLVLVAFSFAGLFAVYSSTFPLLKKQQDTIAATLCLQERLDQMRFHGWSVLTNPVRLQDDILRTPPKSAGSLTGLVEEITVSTYPAAVGASSIKIRRASNGTLTVLSQPTTDVLSAGALVRVDVRASWQGGKNGRVREASALIAFGGIIR